MKLAGVGARVVGGGRISDFEFSRMICGFNDPSDIRFLDGLVCCDRADILSSSAKFEEHIEDISVLVAESEEPSRCHFPLILAFNLPLPDTELPELRSKISGHDDDD